MAVSQNLRGIGAIILATGTFVANDSCMKLALEDAPPLQVLIMRGVAACLWCLPVLTAMGLARQLPKAFHPWVVARSLSETFAIFSFILALSNMPIADVTAIAQTTPLLVLLGVWLFFGEKIGTCGWRWWASASRARSWWRSRVGLLRRPLRSSGS